MLPANSMQPANQYMVITGGVGSGDGNPNSRDMPCSRNNNPTMMRRMLSMQGCRRSRPVAEAEVRDGRVVVACFIAANSHPRP